MIRELGQVSLADALVSHRGKGSKWLEDVEKMIAWAPLAHLLSKLYRSSEGQPAWPPLVMLKALLLQQWYCLSDEAMEAALDDRLSFRRFCGLPLDMGVPDHSTLWRFRERLHKGGLGEKLFAEVNRQIEAKGLMVKRGTLIDASIVPSAVNGPKGGLGEASERDPEAGWTKKNGESTFGYKVHAAVDEETGLVRKAEVTAADLHDVNMGEALMMGDEQAVYADKGYDSEALREAVKAKGAVPRIMKRKPRGKAEPNWLKWLNRCYGAVRSGVERGFATMKGPYGLTRMAYIGRARNGLKVHLIAMAMNLKKMRVLAHRRETCA
jgi:transposase, IS5 family